MTKEPLDNHDEPLADHLDKIIRDLEILNENKKIRNQILKDAVDEISIYRGPYLSEVIKMFEENKLFGGTDDFKQFKMDLDQGNWKEFKINPRDYMSGLGALFKEKVKLS
jgi:hypothetical protein